MRRDGSGHVVEWGHGRETAISFVGGMVSLYGACLGAVVLNWMRGRWGAAGWYPVAVGGVAAMAIIPLMGLAQRGLEAGRRAQAVFFFVVGTGVLVVLPADSRHC